MPDQPQLYRVWNVVNPPSRPYHVVVPDVLTGARIIKRMADRQLRNRNIWGNAFGLEVYRDGDWEEWYDDEGEDVDHSEMTREVWDA